MSFLIPLASVLLVIAVVTVAITSLFLVPWPVLVGLLLVVLYVTQRALLQIKVQDSSPRSTASLSLAQLQTPTAPEKMSEPSLTVDTLAARQHKTLTYRGARYKCAPSDSGVVCEPSHVTLSGKYRGNAWNVHTSAKNISSKNGGTQPELQSVEETVPHRSARKSFLLQIATSKPTPSHT